MAKEREGEGDIRGRRAVAEPDLLRSAEAALRGALPDVEVLDRELSFDDGARADLAGVDGEGRVLLVLFAGDDPDRAAVEVLDAISFALRSGPLLARHLGSDRLRPELEPRVVVVAQPSDRRLATRLLALRRRGVELFEIRRLASAAGERTYLVPAGEGAAGLLGETSPEAFLGSLPAPLAGLARLVVERIQRLDDEVEEEAAADGLAWTLAGRPLARLERTGGRLVARIGPAGRPRAVRDRRDAEEVVEEALGVLVASLGQGGLGPAGGGGGGGLDGARPGTAAAQELLLTREEIEAFHE